MTSPRVDSSGEAIDRAAIDREYEAGARSTLVESYERLAEGSTDPAIYRRLGICLAESKRQAEGADMLRRAIELDPEDATARKRLALLEARGYTKHSSRPSVRGRSSRPRQTQAMARESFLRTFPHGFQDPSYIDRERGYKEAASKAWNEQFGKEAFERRLAAGDFAGLCTDIKKFRNSRSLDFPSPFEIMALNRLLDDPRSQELMAAGVYRLLFSNDFADALNRFVVDLQRAPQHGKTSAVKWPVVTLFPFLARPELHILVKPETMKAAAVRLGVELNYKPVPNSLTYSCALELADRLMNALHDLQPRDMIDIQSFIWVTGSAGYQLSGN